MLAPVTCVLFFILYTQIFRYNPPQPYSSGERLNFASLKASEAIWVVNDETGSRGERFLREYHVTGGATIYYEAFPARGDVASEEDKEPVRRDLTRPETLGLDETMAFFRNTPQEVSSRTCKYTFTYYRDGKKVGEEMFIGHWGLQKINYWHAHRYDDKRNPEYDYLEVVMNYHIARQDIDKFITVEMLAEKQPNKALVPTVMSVTPAADAPVAPATTAAHL